MSTNIQLPLLEPNPIEETESDSDVDDDEAIGAPLFSMSSYHRHAPDINSANADLTKHLDMFRRQMKIKVRGNDIPDPIASFDDMKCPSHAQYLKKILLRNIERSQYTEPTPVQMQAIPPMLLKRDVLAIAPTGSGKTAAFVIPIVAGLHASSGIGAIILAPTRELAQQIHIECLRLSRGKKFRICLLTKATASTLISQIKTNRPQQDIIVATPLRLVHLIKDHQLDLSSVQTICLDEADRLFDMGFAQQIDEVLAACTNKNIHRAMFSATMLQVRTR